VGEIDPAAEQAGNPAPCILKGALESKLFL
jgi:hypothetical protein